MTICPISPETVLYYMERLEFQRQNGFNNQHHNQNQQHSRLNHQIQHPYNTSAASNQLYNQITPYDTTMFNFLPDHILLQRNYSNNPRSKYCLLPFLIMTPVLECFTVRATIQIYEISQMFSQFIFNNLNQVIYHQFMKGSVFAQIDALKRVLLASVMFIGINGGGTTTRLRHLFEN